MAAGFPSQTLLPLGRDPTSSAFFKTAGPNDCTQALQIAPHRYSTLCPGIAYRTQVLFLHRRSLVVKFKITISTNETLESSGSSLPDSGNLLAVHSFRRLPTRTPMFFAILGALASFCDHRPATQGKLYDLSLP